MTSRSKKGLLLLGRKFYPDKWWISLLKAGVLEVEADRLRWTNDVYFQYVWV
jgi:hypothetical protein